VRVVSLVPSATETLLAWGVTPVAVTRFCEQPELLHVGGTKDPDVAAVIALAPDLVVMCDEENRREDANALLAAGVPLHVFGIRTVADVGPELAALAQRLALDDISPVTLTAGAPSGRPAVSAFVPIWRERAGDGVAYRSLNDDTYGSSVLAALGVANVFGDAEDRYPAVTAAQVRDRAPSVVLAPSEPYPFGERHRAELSALAPVVFVDGQDVFWWGVRTPAALARLGMALQGVVAIEPL